MSEAPLDILEEAVQIPSAAGSLPGVLAYPLVGRPAEGTLVVGPHPLMGGRLENNVVRGVGRGLAERGSTTLRFQFFRSGGSADVMERFWRTGRAPDDPLHADDARAAADWLASVVCGRLTLVGYSFGASLLAALLTPRVRGVVLIGATLVQHDYTALAASPVPKLVIAADNDFATPLAATREWCAAGQPPVRLVVLPAAEHFYRGQESRIVEEITQWLAH